MLPLDITCPQFTREANTVELTANKKPDVRAVCSFNKPTICSLRCLSISVSCMSGGLSRLVSVCVWVIAVLFSGQGALSTGAVQHSLTETL